MLGLRRLRWLLPLLVPVLLFVVPVTVSAQTKRDVDRAAEEKTAAYAELVSANQELEASLAVLESIYGRIQNLEWTIGKLQGRIGEFDSDVEKLRTSAQNVVLEAYVNGGIGLVSAAFAANTIQDLLTSQVLIDSAASRDLASLDLLSSVSREMGRLSFELGDREREADGLREEQAAAVEAFENAQERAATVFADAAHKYGDVYARFQAEQRRLAALRAAQQSGGAKGLPASTTKGVACPIPGGSHFIDSWGFPRSGGRTHKGVDMMAPRGRAVTAMFSGSVRLSSHRLGGIQVYLYGDNGLLYYYAHLSGYAPGLSSGQRVAKGQHIAFVGDTGNARGTPHLHLGMGPIGGGLVNPYPTVRAAC